MLPATRQTKDNVVWTAESNPQPAVNIGLFTGWRRAQDRCSTWRQFVKAATLQAGARTDDDDDGDADAGRCDK